MADVEILAQQVSAAPLDYPVPGGQEILVKCLAASFDGTSAAVPWQPAIQVIGPSGQVLRTFPIGPTLAAGASADVSWFPRSGAGVGGGGAGIRFDTYPQTGDWLYTLTDNAAGSPGSYGTEFESTAGIWLRENSSTGLQFQQLGTGGIQMAEQVAVDTGSGIQLLSSSGMVIQDQSSVNGLYLYQTGSGGITVEDNGGGGVVAKSDSGPAYFGGSGLTQLQSNNNDVNILALTSKMTLVANKPIFITALGGTTESVVQVRIVTHGNYFSVMDNTPIEQLRVTPQGTVVFQVADHTGALIFQVRDDGSLHGKTGKTLTFDL